MPKVLPILDKPSVTPVKLNPCPEEKAKIESDKENREVNLTKSYFDEVWNNKRSNLFKKYGN